MRCPARAWPLLAALAACGQPASDPTPSNDSAAAGVTPPAADQAAATSGVTAEHAEPAVPAVEAEDYTARGQEPGWLLTIAGGSMDYQGNYGEKKIRVPAPAPTPTANGRRYETERLTIEITNSRCNDAMSGHGYSDQVKIVADGETYDGCGGARRTDWDT
jgi:uncharacterized membrane protein